MPKWDQRWSIVEHHTEGPRILTYRYLKELRMAFIHTEESIYYKHMTSTNA